MRQVHEERDNVQLDWEAQTQKCTQEKSRHLVPNR